MSEDSSAALPPYVLDVSVLAAVAPIVGTTRVVAAAGRMVKALGAAVELAELAEYPDEG